MQREAAVQQQLFQWAAWARGQHPELDLLFHIPNGGSRDKREAFNLKLQGVKAGVPDLFLPVGRGDYHGLFIELKVKGNRPSEEQKRWIADLNAQGYAAIVCYGFDEARAAVENYLGIIRTY